MADREGSGFEGAAWPTTVAEAVDRLMTELSPADLARLRALPRKDLILEHFGLALWVRDNFGLWQGNEALLEACAAVDRDDPSWYLMIDPDAASGVIVEALYERLVGEATDDMEEPR